MVDNSCKINYRAEGGKGLVVSVKQDNDSRRVVYRLLKRSKNGTIPPSKVGQVNDLNLLEKCEDYINNVMTKVIDRRFIRIPKIVEIQKSFVHLVNQQTMTVRPDYREGTEADTTCNYAFCMDDAAEVPCSISTSFQTCLAVEIKPKIGFLPLDAAQIYESHSIRRAVCRFHMEQFNKIKRRQWKTRSRYCPVDLFSGDILRIQAAIRELVKCPQNNLRLFWNEKQIFSQEEFHDLNKVLCEHTWSIPDDIIHSNNNQLNTDIVWSADDLIDMVTKALLVCPSNTGGDKYRAQNCARSPVINPENVSGTSGLPSGCVLANILNGQLLDSLDIEGLHPFYSHLQQRMANIPELRNEYSLDGPYGENWLTDSPSDSRCKDDSYAVRKVKEYLVSSTAKDCSVIIAIRPKLIGELELEENGIFELSDMNDNKFLVRVSVIDLDIKPTSKIADHLRLVNNTTDHFIAAGMPW